MVLPSALKLVLLLCIESALSLIGFGILADILSPFSPVVPFGLDPI